MKNLFSFESMRTLESTEYGMEGLAETRLSVSGSDAHDNFLTDEPVPESWDDMKLRQHIRHTAPII